MSEKSGLRMTASETTAPNPRAAGAVVPLHRAHRPPTSGTGRGNHFPVPYEKHLRGG